MKGLKKGTEVNFLWRTRENKGTELKEYKKGRIEQITDTGYVIKIVDDTTVRSMDGTLCNRNESVVMHVVKKEMN